MSWCEAQVWVLWPHSHRRIERAIQVSFRTVLKNAKNYNLHLSSYFSTHVQDDNKNVVVSTEPSHVDLSVESIPQINENIANDASQNFSQDNKNLQK